MGLDLYAGSLARYHSGDWELAAQRAGRRAGIKVEIVYPGGASRPPQAVTPSDVRHWRQEILSRYSHLIMQGLDWDEDPSAAYWTEKPDYAGRNALVLAAAYAEHPEWPTPKETPSDLEADPAYAAAGKTYMDSAICILECHMFLPSGENFLFAGPDAVGTRRFVTSTANLAWALDAVNAAHWQADDAEIAGWTRRGPITKKRLASQNGKIVSEAEVAAQEDPFMHWAQFGFALYTEALGFACEHRVPIVTDE